jgi:serine phosphatase RsbU (regulator of sigma subunit)
MDQRSVPAESAEAAEPAEALAAVVARLRAELAGVRAAMRNRAVIEQAKGVLVERLAVGPDEAFDQLVRLSQRSNVKLVEVAASIVGTTAPDPQAGQVTELVDEEMREHVARSRARVPPPTSARPAARKGAGRLPPAIARRARYQLLRARISAARTLDEVAEVIQATSDPWPAPATVVVTLLEADGAQRLVGSAGLSAAVRSQWARIPPHVDVPLTLAVRDREPILLADPAAVRRHFPGLLGQAFRNDAVFAMPLLAEGRLVGALGLSWDTALKLTDDVRRYLGALADPVGRKLVELTQEPSELTHQAAAPALAGRVWLDLVLETLHNPAMLLAPIWQDGHLTDLRVEYANGLADALLAGDRGRTALGASLGDATLLSLYPGIGSQVLLPEFARVLHNGQSCHLPDLVVESTVEGTDRSYLATVRASRLWDRVLMIWRIRTAADTLHDQLLEAERIARIGSFSWQLTDSEPVCSPQLHRLLHGDEGQPGRITVEELTRCVHADDLLALQEAVRRTLVHGKQLSAEFRGAGRLAGHRLRLTAEPVLDTDGSVTAVRGTVQDVTEERHLESRLRQAEEALAAQRRRVEVELQAARALQQALLPSEPELGTAQGLVVRGRCRAAESTGRVEGDWWDAYPLPGGATVLVVGDVAGSGLAAMTAAARLRYAVRAYAALDLGPAEVLMAVNAMLCKMEPERTATLTVARFEPGRRHLRWAAAGRATPVRYRRTGRASVLAGEHGLPVGAAPDTRYAESAVTLVRGERLMLYTDALVGSRHGDLVDAMDVLLRTATHTDPDDVEAIVAHVVSALHGAPDEDMCAVLIRVAR